MGVGQTSCRKLPFPISPCLLAHTLKDIAMILHLDASSRHELSASRYMSEAIVQRIRLLDEEVVHRNLSETGAFLSEDAVSGIFKDPSVRTEAERLGLSFSDELVDELKSARAVVIGTPIYNFGAPASLKAWADLVARRGVTFRYGEDGPIGMLDDKPVYIAIASGGTKVGSEIDFLSPWLRHFLRFIGLKNLRIFDARRSSPEDTETLEAAIADL